MDLFTREMFSLPLCQLVSNSDKHIFTKINKVDKAQH